MFVSGGFILNTCWLSSSREPVGARKRRGGPIPPGKSCVGKDRKAVFSTSVKAEHAGDLRLNLWHYRWGMQDVEPWICRPKRTASTLTDRTTDYDRCFLIRRFTCRARGRQTKEVQASVCICFLPWTWQVARAQLRISELFYTIVAFKHTLSFTNVSLTLISKRTY